MTLHGILWSPLIWLAACSELLVNCYFFHHSPITLCISKFISFTSVILSLLPVLIDPTQYSTFFGNLKQQRIFFLYINQLSLLRSSFSICTFGFHRTLTCPTSLWESTGVRPLEPSHLSGLPLLKMLRISNFWLQHPVFPISSFSTNRHPLLPLFFLGYTQFSHIFVFTYHTHLGQQCQLCSSPQIFCHSNLILWFQFKEWLTVLGIYFIFLG